MDFIDRFVILRAHKYNANTIEGMREERDRKRAGRVAKDAALTMLRGSERRRSRVRKKERTSEARAAGRAREKRRATNDAERG